MRNPGKGRLLTFEPSSGNWRKKLGTDIRNGSVKKYPIIGITFGLRPHSTPIMGNYTLSAILSRCVQTRRYIPRRPLSFGYVTWIPGLTRLEIHMTAHQYSPSL